MKAQADYARAALDAIPGRAGLRAAIEKHDAAVPARNYSFQRLRSGAVAYMSRGREDNQAKLMFQSAGAAARVLFDPQALMRSTGKAHAVSWFAVSPDERWAALGVSSGGSEDAALRFVDVASGRQVGPEIPRVRFGVTWASDSRELLFLRLQEMKPGMAPTDEYQRSTMAALAPGGDEDAIRTLVPAGGSEGASFPVTEFPIPQALPDGRVVLAANDGVSPDSAFWISTLPRLREGKPQWKRLAAREERVTDMAIQGERIWWLSFRDAPRLKLMQGRLRDGVISEVTVERAESQQVLLGVSASSDALWLRLRDGNVERLMRRGLADGSKWAEVNLPVQGSLTLASVMPDLPGALIELQGWTRARQVYRVQADGTVTATTLQPSGPYDAPAELVAEEVMVRSHDGAMVPMSIIHRRGVVRDGSTPTILYGYASYGITEEPFFSTSRLAWLDAGGIFAVANPRGSGVFGRAWHEAGRQATKPNTWRDFIACAEYLIAHRWTTPQRLGILGGSAGGILVGRAMTERPDLFAAVVPAVGLLDAVRAETTANGVPNIPEFGTRTNEAGFRALLAMSSYHHVRDGTRYPAVLLPHGVNDPRVDVWHSSKMAARLQQATTSGRPVLLALDYDAGHGVGSTKKQQFDQSADIYSFMLWQMGVAGYQPRR